MHSPLPRPRPSRSRPATLLLLSLTLALAGSLATLPGSDAPAGATMLAGASTPRELVRTADGRRPNVMVVMLDDMRADELRFMPNTRTYIADRGLAFRNSFSPYPLCCPARASFLLGQYAHNHRVLYHESPYGFGALKDDYTVGSRMHKAGYQTALVGKYLNRYGIQKSRVTGRSSVHYVPRGWTDWMVGLDDGWGGSGGTYSYDNFTQNVNGTVVHHPGKYSSTVIADEVVGLIGKYHRKVNPWFMWVTPVAPHFGGPRESDDPPLQTSATGRKYPIRTPARPAWVRGRFDDRITHAPGVRADGGKAEADASDKPVNIRGWAEALPAEKRAVRNLARQRAEAIFAWDREFGRIIAKLKATGEYRDTILMFTSDNGYFLGEHRLRQGKIRPHEPDLNVPFVVAGPGIQRGARYRPITTFDITATVLDIGYAAPLAKMDGRSRLAQMTGGDAPWTYPVVIEGLLTDVPRRTSDFPSALTISGIRTGRYKLIRYASGEGELYDLRNDPNELTSLWYQSAHRDLRYRMVRLWRQYRSCSGSACLEPLPADLQEGRTFLAGEWHNALAQYDAYYNH